MRAGRFSDSKPVECGIVTYHRCQQEVNFIMKEINFVREIENSKIFLIQDDMSFFTDQFPVRYSIYLDLIYSISDDILNKPIRKKTLDILESKEDELYKS